MAADALAGAPIVLAILLPVFGGTALARQKLTDAAGEVVGLSDLSNDEGCRPATPAGRVVKRAFGRDGLHLASVIVEDGQSIVPKGGCRLSEKDDAKTGG